MRKSVLPWLACVIVALIAIPAFASGAAVRNAPVPTSAPQPPAAAPTVTFKTSAAETGFTAAAAPEADQAFLVRDNFFQDASGDDPQDNRVTINAGEKVSFAQLQAGMPHNVAFSNAQPTSCTQLTGNPIDTNTSPPMPDLATNEDWTGECRFNTGGTYNFFCTQHEGMEGTIEVEGGTATPTPTVTVTPTQTPSGRPHIVAKDAPFRFEQAAGGAPSVTIKVGQTVDFSYPASPTPNVHNVDFRRDLTKPTNGPQPTCVQTAGIGPYPAPPLPQFSLPPGWAGNCTFNEAGRFTFVCAAHPVEMQGVVVVETDQPTEPPDTTITGGPTGSTTQTSHNFTFTSDKPAATFECKLDRPGTPGTYAACTTPAAFTTTTDGAYTFTVRAVLNGTPDPSPATRSFTVDRQPPDTSINSGPSGTVTTTSNAFQFAGNETGVTFECRLDTPAGNGSFAACTSPQSYTTTANGAYTFHVRARDAAGNVDPEPATRTFTVDTAAPDTTITSGPTGTTNNASPSFGFTAETGATFECRLDGPGSTVGTWVACTSPRAVGPLTDGTYTFNVRARDLAGNTDASPATRTFTVETAAPDTNITGGPTGTTNSTSASFTFTSTKPNSTFECRLDTPAGNGTFAACTSPQTYTTTANGAYTFHVRAIDGAGNPDASPATRTFTVDTSAPDTTIDSGPTGTITNNSPQFTFSSSETGSTFECRLDGPGATPGTWQTCTSPRILGSLADGAYTFNVRATDGAGNVDATPATRTFTVDAAAPDTTIDSGPTGTITNASPQFAFSSSETGSTFECRLDGPGSATGTYQSCTSPRTLGPLADGTYTFLVRAVDAAGNADGTPASRTFTVDATVPNTTIDSGPTGTITNASPQFTFSSSEPGSSFECRLDGPGSTTGTYQSCTSPRTLGPLADGTYTFSVRALDAAGNTDATPATRTFTVETSLPDTSITGGPVGTTSNASPSFTFTSTKPGSTFECRLDGPGSATGTFAACTSPHAVGPLADGSYTLQVRARDGAGNLDPTPATRQFTVDTAAPNTTIDSGPTGTINTTSASFTFSGSEPGSTFECKLDTGEFTACTSPQAYTDLAVGEHTFSVRAKDAAGNVDATPATRTFTVDAAAPDTTIDSGPTGTINGTSATFTFSGSEPGSTFECKLDRPGTPGTYAACTSPQAYTGLAAGEHTFSVRAKDAAGNVDATPATRTFTVDTAAPDTTITGGPTGATNNGSPQFTFESSKPGSTFECRLDGPGSATGTWVACTSPRAVGPLADGAYTFNVRAKDAAGNVDDSPATRQFTVDTAAPDTTIDSGPTHTETTSASFTFSSTEAGATFECKLDRPGTPGTFAACTSPQNYTGLANGEYTFSVRAKDAAGNVDPTPATRTFTADISGPDTTITGGPTGTITNASPQFTFEASRPNSSFECRLDGPGTATGTYAACTSPRTLGPLADGEYTFRVRAKNASGTVDETPATRTFTVDTTAPNTTIESGPTGTVSSTTATFTFSGSETGSTFECKLDGGEFTACTSPQTYTGLAAGEHTFSVRARDAAGHVDATPATRTFTVDTTAPDTTVEGPTGTITTPSASFTFTSTKPNSTFECKLDRPSGAGTYAACTSPQAYTGLANGAYTFSVRAKDAAGNVDATPATRTFTVQVAAPDTTITGGPTGTISETTQTFTFSGDAGVTFECRLDTPAGQGEFSACTSPKTYTASTSGNYTFWVRAKDANGTVDPTPASRTFTLQAGTPTETSVDAEVSGIVPTVLGLTLNGPAAFPPFIPGVGTTYEATLGATITSSADKAELAVVDRTGVQPGRLVNGTYVLTDPLQVRALRAGQDNPLWNPVSATPVRLLAYPAYIASDQVTIAFRQTVRNNEALLAGEYTKTLTFTLSSTQP
ncbi:Ig-like domain repeat protein [Solirubrobacter sp. CPCC 204708]|uniref:Ig-like domain-containing protein n=1 Tax=Solirubrobacter deserti TaxID=2282478 RepID=A0ABT4RDD9_9ACTN|nr:Ig-like domain-containing protein [Solirubrobacter deserti]MBE2314543.1 Ig-like domain repeat protein [Solirubrobacter deserti]MDA0136547.1 Ig-like domain-containing protein [Solirubrobacter deserti]